MFLCFVYIAGDFRQFGSCTHTHIQTHNLGDTVKRVLLTAVLFKGWNGILVVINFNIFVGPFEVAFGVCSL